jgi:hypothetical protein
LRLATSLSNRWFGAFVVSSSFVVLTIHRREEEKREEGRERREEMKNGIIHPKREEEMLQRLWLFLQALQVEVVLGWQPTKAPNHDC